VRPENSCALISLRLPASPPGRFQGDEERCGAGLHAAGARLLSLAARGVAGTECKTAACSARLLRSRLALRMNTDLETQSPMRTITNSAGFTGARPSTQMSRPLSMSVCVIGREGGVSPVRPEYSYRWRDNRFAGSPSFRFRPAAPPSRFQAEHRGASR